MRCGDISIVEETAIPLICGDITRRKTPFLRVKFNTQQDSTSNGVKYDILINSYLDFDLTDWTIIWDA